MVAFLGRGGRTRPPGYEDPYYWSTGAGFYQGKYPAWFDDRDNPAKEILEANYEAIRAEVLDFYERRPDRLRTNWLQWGYSTEGWLTVDMYSYGMRKPQQCKDFPVLEGIARTIPGMMLVQISVLNPGVTIRPHVSETAALVRSHLPVLVPGKLPELGIRVGAETRDWTEGEVMALNIAYRHRAWNLTDKPRIVVVVDCIHPDFADRKLEVQSHTLALSAMKGWASSFPRLKRAPQRVTDPVRATLAAIIRVLLRFEQSTGCAVTAAVAAYRPPGRRK